jgi:hypothetical protein
MTGPDSSHAVFEELAAGHALHALEPAEEQRFLAHQAGCQRCQQALAGYAEITSALASIAPPAEPSPRLGQRILAAARSREAGVQPGLGRPPVPRVPPRHRRGTHGSHRRAHWIKISAAAAGLAAAAAGVWGGLAATSGGPASPGPACVRTRGCAEVALISAGRGEAAKVIVAGNAVWLQPLRLRPDDQASHIYVLWQITGTHTPLAIGSFDVRPGRQRAIRIGPLAVPYHDTWAFAVSLERGRAIPAAPSRPVALGQVSA